MWQVTDTADSSGENVQPTELGECVARLTDAISEGVDLEITRHKLLPNEFAVLQLFWERDEWTATQLVELLPFDPSRMSRLVAKLVDRRLMRRRRVRTDRRVVLLALTEKGTKLMAEIRESMQAYEATLLDGVSSQEMDGFISTTHQIIRNHTQHKRSIGE